MGTEMTYNPMWKGTSSPSFPQCRYHCSAAQILIFLICKRWQILQHSKRGEGVTFLSPNKKVTKEVGLRGVECRAPARQSHPLKNPPAAFGKILPFYLFFPLDVQRNGRMYWLLDNLIRRLAVPKCAPEGVRGGWLWRAVPHWAVPSF